MTIATNLPGTVAVRVASSLASRTCAPAMSSITSLTSTAPGVGLAAGEVPGDVAADGDVEGGDETDAVGVAGDPQAASIKASRLGATTFRLSSRPVNITLLLRSPRLVLRGFLIPENGAALG